MRKVCVQLFVLLAVPSVLSGCSGDIATGGGTPAPAAVIDESVLTANTGTVGDPYILPTTMPADTDGGVHDYLNADPGGYWKVGYSGLQVDLGAGTPVFGDLVYDQTNDQWLLAVDSIEYTLQGSGIAYATKCNPSGKPCAGFLPYDDPSKTLYGIFGYIGYTDQSTTTSVFVMHTGLKTTDMPTGTAQYSGVFAGALIGGTGQYAALGTTTIGVDFEATVDQVTFKSSGKVYDAALLDYDVTDLTIANVGTYTLDGSATIAGNTYTSSTITGTSTGPVADSYTGDLDAAFYGPGAVQTAGAVKTSSASGNILAGGYWAEKQ